MFHPLPTAPRLFVTTPQPCPYLEGQRERKLFTTLSGSHAAKLNNFLSKQGFRRSQNVLYRPSCPSCTACRSVRVVVDGFVPSRSQRRVLKRNANLERRTASPWATEEQYALFRDYLECRHPEGGMADMDIFEFAAMVEDSPVQNQIIEYAATTRNGQRRLAAVCLTDIHDDGLSMVYSFFDPARLRDSLGTYVILDHINLAREAGLKYIYLGYWVPGSDKMNYKVRFGSMEIYINGHWNRIEKVPGHRTALQEARTSHPESGSVR